MEAVGAFQLNGFRLGVGGHDGMGRIRTGLSGIGKGRERFVCARKHMVKRQKLTDQARGADRDIAVFGTTSAATFWAVALDCSYPGWPVHAFAPPELRMTAFT